MEEDDEKGNEEESEEAVIPHIPQFIRDVLKDNTNPTRRDLERMLDYPYLPVYPYRVDWYQLTTEEERQEMEEIEAEERRTGSAWSSVPIAMEEKRRISELDSIQTQELNLRDERRRYRQRDRNQQEIEKEKIERQKERREIERQEIERLKHEREKEIERRREIKQLWEREQEIERVKEIEDKQKVIKGHKMAAAQLWNDEDDYIKEKEKEAALITAKKEAFMKKMLAIKPVQKGKIVVDASLSFTTALVRQKSKPKSNAQFKVKRK